MSNEDNNNNNKKRPKQQSPKERAINKLREAKGKEAQKKIDDSVSEWQKAQEIANNKKREVIDLLEKQSDEKEDFNDIMGSL